MKLHILNSGYLIAGGNSIIQSGANEQIRVVVPFYLIEHHNGLILIDGGNAKEVSIDAYKHWGNAANAFKVEMNESDFVVERIKQLGFNTNDIKFVIQTHLHLDHSGALGQFKNAKYIVRKAERR